MVEEVENLCPQLHIDPLAWFEDLVQRSIDSDKPGPGDGVSSQVAKGPWLRRRKGTRIIPPVRSPQRLSRGYFDSSQRAPCCNARRGIVTEARVQVGTVRRPPVPVLGNVRSHARGKRFPCAERANSIKLPAAQNRPHGFLLEFEWNGIGGGEDKIVSRVERRSLTLSWSYELPIGKGKMLGKNWTGAKQAVFGGWKFNSIDSFYSGSPFSVISGTNTLRARAAAQR